LFCDATNVGRGGSTLFLNERGRFMPDHFSLSPLMS